MMSESDEQRVEAWLKRMNAEDKACLSLLVGHLADQLARDIMNGPFLDKIVKRMFHEITKVKYAPSDN